MLAFDDRILNLVRMAEYIDAILPLMKLSHWQIVVGEDIPPDGNEAEIHHSKTYHIATVYFSDDHFTRPEPEQRATVIHELVHLHFNGLDSISKDAFERLDPTSKTWAHERWFMEKERSVDSLARIIARWLPPIPQE